MTENSELDWAYLADLAGRVAYSIAERWHIVEADDVKQAILEHAIRERKNVALAVDDQALLKRIFWTAGKRYAAKERLYRDLVDGEYFYTADEAKTALLTMIYTAEEFSGLIGKKDDLNHCTVSENLHTARLDAEDAMRRINERYQRLLHSRYVLGIPLASDADQKACQRAVIALSYEMNRSLRRKIQK
ncbi:hypothetical protein [Streptomyces sp. NRRL F-2580]|uniref:hypothetical protein n=1 Tax=Streptomyces sp. NRRL F-2580 TaxID=1463841 RepID=UPI0004C82F48|nr:hypothetical protein [Streptomyces sp. NRRL F-2580]